MSTKSRTFIGVLFCGLSLVPAFAEGPAEGRALTLDEALAFAVQHSPRFQAQSLALRSSQAQQRQAGLRANPEIEVEIENVGGPGEAREFKAAETTVQLTQSLDPAGKRGKRAQLASRAVEIAAWELEIARLDLIAEVRQRFVEVHAAQERVALFAELAKLHQTTLRAVSERVAAGKSAPAEEARARIDLAEAKIRSVRARRELAAARHRLAATWGDATPTFTAVTGDFYGVTPPPAYTETAQLLNRSPDVAWQALEAGLREAAVNLERANRLPELTLSGGVRHANDTGDMSFVMGLSVPLPLFDRNQGAVKAAEFDRAASDADRRATEANVHASLVDALHTLASTHHAVKELAEVILPDSEKVFAATLEGYRTGKFAYLTVLDAQHTLFEARAEHVDALEAYHNANAELDRLIGADLRSPESDEKR